MGEIVEFASNGKTAQGYLALPESNGPGVVVIQEWWGLVPHIKNVCDRFAAEGFVALAPDLYHGEATKEPDEAGKLLMSLEIDRAGRDMAGAYDFLIGNARVEPKKAGVVGFCAGGTLAILLGTLRPLAAVVPYYPFPFIQEPDVAKIEGALMAHIAEHDQAPTPAAARDLVERMRALGKEAELHVYPGTDHAFFNDERTDVHKPEAARESWDRTIAFFRKHLG